MVTLFNKGTLINHGKDSNKSSYNVRRSDNFLSEFHKNWNVLLNTVLSEILNINFHAHLPGGNRVLPVGQTDGLEAASSRIIYGEAAPICGLHCPPTIRTACISNRFYCMRGNIQHK
jgi:hypothetical protein